MRVCLCIRIELMKRWVLWACYSQLIRRCTSTLLSEVGAAVCSRFCLFLRLEFFGPYNQSTSSTSASASASAELIECRNLFEELEIAHNAQVATTSKAHAHPHRSRSRARRRRASRARSSRPSRRRRLRRPRRLPPAPRRRRWWPGAAPRSRADARVGLRNAHWYQKWMQNWHLEGGSHEEWYEQRTVRAFEVQ